MKTLICHPVRTPIGSFEGSLSQVSGPDLAAGLIRSIKSECGLDDESVDELILGTVLTAGVGQAPARQVCLKGGLSESTHCMSINKVCSSGLQAVVTASERIKLGVSQSVIAGGMENMSQAPFLLPDFRSGGRLGHKQALDSMILDGLWDPFCDQHMGNCAELCAEKYGLSREVQDEYALESYSRAQEAASSGKFKAEISPVEFEKRRKKIVVSEDEEPGNLKREKVPDLRPAFKKDGTVTAANASSINDGAAAMLICSEDFAKTNGLKPVAEIKSSGRFAQAPEWFTTAPVNAIRQAVDSAGVSLADVELFEINEAFSAVALACSKDLGIDSSKLNIHGGAVALGHPIGASGSRILVTLIHALKQSGKTLGAVGICNGGGEATSLVVELV